MTVKLIILYPHPKDREGFEQAYTNDHIPLVAKSLTRLTKAAYTRVLMSPAGASAFCRIAELYYPSLEALQADFSTPEADVLNAQAAAISTGGPATVLVCEEDTVVFSDPDKVKAHTSLGG